MKEKIIKYLDRVEFWDALVSAWHMVAVIMAWAIFLGWCFILGVTGLVVGLAILSNSFWWILAVIPWLVLVVLTIAVYRAFIKDLRW